MCDIPRQHFVDRVLDVARILLQLCVKRSIIAADAMAPRGFAMPFRRCPAPNHVPAQKIDFASNRR